jgi:hypothetical protein
MYKFLWQLRARLDQAIYDERTASRVRGWFVVFLTLTLVLLGYNLFEDIDTTAWATMWQNRYPLFGWLPVVIVRSFNFAVYGFRHMIIPVAVLLGMWFASAAYVQDVYELPNYRLGMDYIRAAFLGIGYPNLTIAEGKKQIPKGVVNLIDTIGGPGYVNIRPGNVVLFESLRSPSSVRASTVNFISRFETIKEIVSLDDQHGFIEEVKAKTKDGIEVTLRDVHYRYRLRTGRRYGDHERRHAMNPYPYSIQAVKDMAYNRSVTGAGLSSWHVVVRLAFDGGITDFIRASKFDNLTAPNYEDADPRAEIAKNMSKGIRLRLRTYGAELLWFDVGHFGVSDRMKEAVSDQRVDTWSARWDGDAMVVRSYGEARRLAYQDMGRAEGQADLLLSIIQALDEAGFEGGFGEGEQQVERLKNLRSIIWMRIAQILDASAEEGREDLNNNNPPPRLLK